MMVLWLASIRYAVVVRKRTSQFSLVQFSTFGRTMKSAQYADSLPELIPQTKNGAFLILRNCGCQCVSHSLNSVAPFFLRLF